VDVPQHRDLLAAGVIDVGAGAMRDSCLLPASLDLVGYTSPERSRGVIAADGRDDRDQQEAEGAHLDAAGRGARRPTDEHECADDGETGHHERPGRDRVEPGRLGLYSGLPDPSWELSDEEATDLSTLLESLPRVDGSAPSGGLGYHGFTIERLTPEGMPRLLVAFEGTVSDPLSSRLAYLDDSERSVERFLLDSGRDQLSAVEVMAPGLDPGPVPSPGSSAETQ
jgi:hypothetical protein